MSSDDEMTCRELVELVTEYLENTLPEDERVRLEDHLKDCEYCQQYVEQMRGTVDALGRLDPESLDPETERRLLDAFRGWRRGTRARRSST